MKYDFIDTKQSTEESPREEILQKGTDNQKLQRELTRCKEQLVSVCS